MGFKGIEALWWAHNHAFQTTPILIKIYTSCSMLRSICTSPFTILAMHSFAAAGRHRLSETEPKWFVLTLIPT